MAEQKPFENSIQALYRRKAIDQLMFGFILGARAALETISIEKAIEMFYIKFGLTEDDYPMQSAQRIYYKMQKEYLNLFN